MSESKTLLLDAMIEAMEVVIQAEQTLKMYEYYDSPNLVDNQTTIHTCETTACIAGYAALHLPVKRICAERDGDFINPEDPNDPRNSVSTLSNQIHNPEMFWPLAVTGTLYNEIGLPLGGAICSIDAGHRTMRLRGYPGKLPTEIRNHEHLRIDDPKPEVAVDFMKKVRDYYNSL